MYLLLLPLPFPLLDAMPLVWLAILFLLMLNTIAEGRLCAASMTAAVILFGLSISGITPSTQAVTFVVVWISYHLLSRLCRIAFRGCVYPDADKDSNRFEYPNFNSKK